VRRRPAAVPGLLALLVAGTLAAQATAPAPAAVPGSELSVSLMTMGVGAEVWERFGHNAIVIEDHRLGTSVSYNYGMFSFRQEHFLLRFLQGRMNYWMAGYPTGEDVPRYIAARRSVWLQELTLTPAARLALRDFLRTNARPENAFYRYDYYRDNCSTRVRDALDRVLGGALRAQMGGPGSGTYRFHTLRLNANNIPLYTGLDLVLGHRVDAPITKWEEMFLPLKLREYLAEAKVPDSTGALVPLVRSERTVFESRAFPVPDAPPTWGPGYFVVGLGLGTLLGWAGRAGRRSAGARRLLIGLGTAWTFATGLSGTILAFLWAFTDHVVASANENILQASLFALPLAVLLPLTLQEGNIRARRGVRTLGIVVGGLSLLGMLLKVLPAFHQANGQILALFVPANLGLMLGLLAWTGRTDPLTAD
jgi:Domain of unknown function (DUF4105)